MATELTGHAEAQRSPAAADDAAAQPSGAPAAAGGAGGAGGATSPGRRIAFGVASVAGAALVTILLAAAFHPTFMVNDDAVMAALASGDYTGSPDPHLVFIGAIPGLLLAGAYELVPGVAWYGALLAFCQCCCLAAVVAAFRLHRMVLDTWKTFALALTLLAFVPVFTLRLSFTVAAILLAVCALLLWTLALDRAAQRDRSARALAVLGAVAMATAGMIRSESLLAAAIVFVPVLLVLVARAGLRAAALVAAATLGVMAVGELADRALYAGDEWSSFMEFNAVRGELHGSARFGAAVTDPSAPAMVDALSENEWTLDDVYLFGGWFYDDRDVYTTDRLERLRDAAAEASVSAPVSDAIRSVTDPHRPLVVVVLVTAIAAAMGGTWRRWMLLVAQDVWAFAVFAAVAWRERFPDRIGFPLFFGLAMVNLLTVRLFPRDDARLPAEPLRRLSAAVAAAAGVLVFFGHSAYGPYRPSAISANGGDLRTYVASQVAALRAFDPDGRFVYVGDVIPTEGVNPFRQPGSYESGELLGLGWPIHSPSHEQRKEHMGVAGDLVDALVANDHAHLVTTRAVADLVERTYTQRRGIAYDVVEELDLGWDVVVFRVDAAAG